MALGWLSVLKIVPWSDVIANAPVVVDGAKRLWGTVSRQPLRDTPPAAQAHAPAPNPLEGRIAELETALAEQHTQLVTSSELIKALADQNAQLIARLGAQRRVLLGLVFATAAVGVLAAAALWLHFE